MTIPEVPERLACYRHANRLTGAQCTRCGRPICPDCMIEAPVGHHCPTCAREGTAAGPAPARWSPTDRARGLTPVVKTLIAINVVVYLLTLNVGTKLRYAQIPFYVAHGESWRLLTAAFLHASIIHILFNMFALAILGPPVEEVMGRNRFVALYLLSALGGSVLSFMLGGLMVPSVGASGAIYGIFGAWFCIARARRAETSGIVIMIAINLAISFSNAAIDWRAHVGGLVTGLALGGVFALGERSTPAQRRFLEIMSGIALVLLMLVLVIVRTDQIRAIQTVLG